LAVALNLTRASFFEMAPKGDLELNTGIQISILKANSLDG
jgi:hypothetical protein